MAKYIGTIKEINCIVEKIGRGDVQKNFLRDLLIYGRTKGICTYCKQDYYFNAYLCSFQNIIKRFCACYDQYKVEFVCGPRGGCWLGYYKLI